jgi:hypothetical protein
MEWNKIKWGEMVDENEQNRDQSDRRKNHTRILLLAITTRTEIQSAKRGIKSGIIKVGFRLNGNTEEQIRTYIRMCIRTFRYLHTNT